MRKTYEIDFLVKQVKNKYKKLSDAQTQANFYRIWSQSYVFSQREIPKKSKHLTKDWEDLFWLLGDTLSKIEFNLKSKEISDSEKMRLTDTQQELTEKYDVLFESLYPRSARIRNFFRRSRN